MSKQRMSSVSPSKTYDRELVLVESPLQFHNETAIDKKYGHVDPLLGNGPISTHFLHKRRFGITGVSDCFRRPVF
jgi:hypothetical protein